MSDTFEVGQMLHRATLLQGERRDEVAEILRTIARDGLPNPRDLDIALDAIEQAFLNTPND